jgi:hypothetical protein
MTTNPAFSNPASSSSVSSNPRSSVSIASDSIASTARSASPYVAAAVVGLLGVGWYLSGHRDDDGMQLTSAAQTRAHETVGRQAPEMTAAEVRMELYSSVSAVRVALQAMTNPATTQTYLPQLQKAAERLDRVHGLVEQLSPAARQGMAAALAPTMRPLHHMLERVLAMPEVADAARPTIDHVRSRLDALSRA